MSVLSKVLFDEPRDEMVRFKLGFSVRLVILFTVLTLFLTSAVILTWEQVLKPPYYRWVESNYPGSANAENRDKLEQRTEHFFISMTVDLIVVSILLVIVDRKQRRLVEAHQQLAHNEKVATLGRVAAQVAHEVRNPLAGLLLYSEHLKGKIDGKLPNGDAQLMAVATSGTDAITVETALRIE